MSQLKQIYRCSFSTLFLWLLVVLLLFDAIRSCLFEGIPIGQISVLKNLTNITITSGLTAGLLVYLLKNEVTTDGIRSYSFLGQSAFVRWDEIVDARNLNFLGLGYFHIRDEKGLEIRVPRYFSRQREFELVVSAIIKRENPLRGCIERVKEHPRA